MVDSTMYSTSIITAISLSPSPYVHHRPPLKEYELHPIESQYGLLNIAEALQFLHSGVRLMHGNITPEAIVVTGSGTWKLMGFNFSCYSQYQSEAQVKDRGREREGKGGREGGRGRISEDRGRKGR